MKSLLIIEPDSTLAGTYERYFKKKDFKVLLASSAQEALEIVDSSLPHAVVLDLQLGGHGGVEFLYELRSYSDLPNIPVVVYTMIPKHALDSYRKALSLLGVNSWLCKSRASLGTLHGHVQQSMRGA